MCMFAPCLCEFSPPVSAHDHSSGLELELVTWTPPLPTVFNILFKLQPSVDKHQEHKHTHTVYLNSQKVISKKVNMGCSSVTFCSCSYDNDIFFRQFPVLLSSVQWSTPDWVTDTPVLTRRGQSLKWKPVEVFVTWGWAWVGHFRSLMETGLWKGEVKCCWFWGLQKQLQNQNFTVDNFSPTTVTEYSILMGGKERNNNQKCQIAAI